jgi:hypothetical protein
MLAALIWLCCALMSAAVAERKGRSVLVWLLAGVVLGPVGLILSIINPGGEPSASVIKASGRKKCPRCAEVIKADALVCRFCQCPTPLPEKAKPKRDGRPTTEKLWGK